MHNDEQYGQQLGAQLRHEIERVHAAPDLVGTLRRRLARRSWAIRTALATPVAAAAVAAAIFVAGPGAPGSGLLNTEPPNSVVAAENVAYVQEQTIKALGQASQLVIYAKSTYDGGYYETWTDRVTQRYRNDVYGRSDANGPIHLNQSHAVSGPEGDQTVVTVDYDHHWWSTDHMTLRRPPSASPDITDAEAVEQAIADGTVELLGHETVDGFDTLHLLLYGPDRSYRIDMWVDATTHLPVRDVATKSSGKPGADDFPAAHAVTTTYSWLPRTDENLARLVLVPPPGYQKD